MKLLEQDDDSVEATDQEPGHAGSSGMLVVAWRALLLLACFVAVWYVLSSGR